MKLNLSCINSIFSLNYQRIASPLFMVALLFFGMSCGDNQDANDNANLSSLSLSGVQIDAFSADTLNYTASVDNSVTQITVTAVAADSNASVNIEPDSSVDLDVGENTIKITVTAADGMTEKIYTVTVTRAQLQSPPPPPPAPENNNANLSSLSLSGRTDRRFLGRHA